SSGFRSPRLGPMEPLPPASASVWQPEQLLVKTSLPETAPPLVVGLEVPPLLDPPQPDSAAASATTIAVARPARTPVRLIVMPRGYTPPSAAARAGGAPLRFWGWWQAARWPGACATSGGSSLEQISVA